MKLSIKIFSSHVEIKWDGKTIDLQKPPGYPRTARVDYAAMTGLFVCVEMCEDEKAYPGFRGFSMLTVQTIFDAKEATVYENRDSCITRLNAYITDPNLKFADFADVLARSDIDLVYFAQSTPGLKNSIYVKREEEVERALLHYYRRPFVSHFPSIIDKSGHSDKKEFHAEFDSIVTKDQIIREQFHAIESLWDYAEEHFMAGLGWLEQKRVASLHDICRRKRMQIEASSPNYATQKVKYLKYADDPELLVFDWVKYEAVDAKSLPPDVPLLGREEELRSIRFGLMEKQVVTLIGVGGGGKTHLMIRAAWSIRNNEGDEIQNASVMFSDGFCYVDLVPVQSLQSVDDLAEIVLAELGAHEVRKERPLFTLIDYLRERHILLLIDNCEHLTIFVKQLIDNISRCKYVRLLITTRDAPGEGWGKKLAVEPFTTSLDPDDLPQLAEAKKDTALKLFEEFRREKRVGFNLHEEDLPAAVQICRLTEGIPLALRIAARQPKSLSGIVRSLTEYLDELPEERISGKSRQDTMEDCIGWSHDLQPAAACILFRRLANFAGEWNGDLCREVCSIQGLSNTNIDEALNILCECFLVQRLGTNRYRVLEPIRKFATAKLQESGEADEIIERFEQWIPADINLEDLWMVGSRPDVDKEASRRVAEFAENLLGMKTGGTLAELRLQLKASTVRYGQGAIASVAKALPALAAFSDKRLSSEYRMNIYLTSAVTNFTAGYYEQTLIDARKGLSIAEEAKHEKNVAFASSGLGITAAFLGLAEARNYVERGLMEANELRDPLAIAFAKMCVGAYYWQLGEMREARRGYGEALKEYRILENSMMTFLALNSLAHIVCREDGAKSATVLYMESLTISSKTNNARGMAGCVLGASGVAYKSAAYDETALLHGAGLAQYERIGSGLIPPIKRDYDKEMNEVKARLGQEHYEQAFERGRRMSLLQAAECAGKFFIRVAEQENSQSRSD